MSSKATPVDFEEVVGRARLVLAGLVQADVGGLVVEHGDQERDRVGVALALVGDEADDVLARPGQDERGREVGLFAGDDGGRDGLDLAVLALAQHQFDLAGAEGAVGRDVQLDGGAAVVLEVALAADDAVDVLAGVGPGAVGGEEVQDRRRGPDLDLVLAGAGVAADGAVVEAVLDLQAGHGGGPFVRGALDRLHDALLDRVGEGRPGQQLDDVGARPSERTRMVTGRLTATVVSPVSGSTMIRVVRATGPPSANGAKARLRWPNSLREPKETSRTKKATTSTATAMPAQPARRPLTARSRSAEARSLAARWLSGALDGRRQLRVAVQVEPVDDAVLGARGESVRPCGRRSRG